MCVEQGVRNLSIWLKKFCMIFRGDNTAYCVLFAFELLSCIKNNKELGGLGWNAEYHPFFFFFYIFSQNRRKNFFSLAMYTWMGRKANYLVSSFSYGSHWIQLILVSHEWGIFKHPFFDNRKSSNSNTLSDVTEFPGSNES